MFIFCVMQLKKYTSNIINKTDITVVKNGIEKLGYLNHKSLYTVVAYDIAYKTIGGIHMYFTSLLFDEKILFAAGDKNFAVSSISAADTVICTAASVKILCHTEYIIASAIHFRGVVSVYAAPSANNASYGGVFIMAMQQISKGICTVRG